MRIAAAGCDPDNPVPCQFFFLASLRLRHALRTLRCGEPGDWRSMFF